MEFDVVVNLESWANGEARARRTLRLDARVEGCKIRDWKVDGREETPESSSKPDSSSQNDGPRVAMLRNFEFRLPLSWLLATPGSSASMEPGPSVHSASKLRLRFSLWQNRLPVDALPLEGWIELHLLGEADFEPGM
jgi:hypothetical protein